MNCQTCGAIECPHPKCQTCQFKHPAFPGGKLCGNCWEVEHRLADYIRSTAGRRFVINALGAGANQETPVDPDVDSGRI